MGPGLYAVCVAVPVGVAIVVLIRQYHPVGVRKAAALRVHIGGLLLIPVPLHYVHKVRQFHSVLGYPAHVPGRAVVVLAVKAVGVRKMGVPAPQFLRLLVHKLYKIALPGIVRNAVLAVILRVPLRLGRGSRVLPCPGRVLRVRSVRRRKLPALIQAVHMLHQRNRRVVARGYHQKVQKLQARQLLPHLHVRKGTARALQVVLHGLGHGYLRVLYVGDILIRHDIRHYLRHGRHRQRVVGVQGIDHRVRVYVQHKQGLAVGPVAVGLRAYQAAVIYVVPPQIPVEGKALRRRGQGRHCRRQRGQNYRCKQADKFHLFIPPHPWYNVTDCIDTSVGRIYYTLPRPERKVGFS